jgi:dipeptidyl aminopeptidase/acylaminoacyl peptidase
MAGYAQESVNGLEAGTKSNNNTSKLEIDKVALQNWEAISPKTPIVSGDGKYFIYWLMRPNLPIKVILQSIADEWKLELGSARPIGFTKNNQLFLYKVKDSLCFFDLKKRKLSRAITGIKNSQHPSIPKPISWLDSEGHDLEWSGWQLNNSNDLYVYNSVSGIRRQYPNVSNYLFNQQGTVLVLQKTNNQIEWIDQSSNQSYMVWTGDIKDAQIGAMAIDDAGKQLAFVLQKNVNGQTENSIWIYRPGMNRAVEKANNQSEGVDKGLHINNSVSFSPDGQYVALGLQRLPLPLFIHNDVKIDIWNYKDTFLQSTQLHSSAEGQFEPTEYTASLCLNNNRLVQFDHKFGDKIKTMPVREYVILSNNTNGDRFWINQADSNWLISAIDGSRKLLIVANDIEYHFSPDSKYLLFYDGNVHNYYSHELATGKTMNLTGSLPALTMAEKGIMYTYPFNQPGKKLITKWTKGVAGWMEGAKKVLVYDDYDIWQLDLSGSEAPINLTAGFGAKSKIQFRLATSGEQIFNIPWNRPLILVAFDQSTKENGFYQSPPSKESTPEKLTMGPYTYFHPPRSMYLSINNDPGIPPIPAANNNTWIIKRQSDKEAVNYYLTHDFKHFKPLTNSSPDKKYNWPEAQLITWTRDDSDINQGLLYKPTNFDPTKKYPVIVIAYIRQSDGLRRYLTPNYSNSPIFNIPYIVSRDYLVFVPDLHYMLGAHGKSALVSIEGGIKELAHFPYVDTSRMALTGHSFSGQTAFYTAANSHLFKAIIAGAGWTDMISSYLQLATIAGKAKNDSYMDFLEGNFNHYNIWERPDIYQAESPVLKADKVSTPLLIFHSEADSKPFEQAVEMFLALRRLQKPAWLLQYDGAGHVVDGDQAIDFTKRILQFFDHYLKEVPAPRWMTNGVRASQKGIDDGYELDRGGKCATSCTVCNKPQK